MAHSTITAPNVPGTITFRPTLLGLPLPVFISATIAASAVGVVYALSPMIVWFTLGTAGILAWACSDLPPRERRWVLWVLGVAISLRVLAIAGLFLSSYDDGLTSFFYDGDGLYLKRRSLWIRNVWLGIPIASYDFPGTFDSHYGWTSYVYVLAYLQYLLGPAPYGVHLFNVALFLAGAVALYRMVRPTYGPLAALVGLVVLLFLPSLFLWSISALKESLQFFLAAVTVAATVRVVRAPGWLRRALALIVSIGALAALGTVRAGSFVIGAVGIVGGVLASLVTRRLAWLIGSLLVLSAVSAHVLSQPDVKTRIMRGLRFVAMIHIGNVRTMGHGYKLLDQRFYSENAVSSMTEPEALRFVVRAAVSFLIVPVPWQLASRSELVYLPEQIAWYALAVLAVVGFAAGIRRDAVVTCLLTGYALIGAAVVALGSGNVGSMVRHRGIVVPFIVWLSALGGVHVLSRLTARRTPCESRGEPGLLGRDVTLACR